MPFGEEIDVTVQITVDYDQATVAWRQAVITAGGTVSQLTQNWVNSLIVGLKADGLFSILDRMWILALAVNNTHQAQIDLVANASWTQQGGGSPTLDANGWTGDGVSAYLDSGFNPTSGTPNYSLNSASQGSYVFNNRTVGQAYSTYGIVAAPGSSFITPLQSGPTTFGGINVTGNNTITTAVTTTQGNWVYTRTSSTVESFYVNEGANLYGSPPTSTAVPNGNFYIGARNRTDLSSVDAWSADSIGAVFFGGGLSTTQAKQMANHINGIMKSLGKSVY